MHVHHESSSVRCVVHVFLLLFIQCWVCRGTCVSTIRSQAFSKCSSLVSVTLPPSVRDGDIVAMLRICRLEMLRIRHVCGCISDALLTGGTCGASQVASIGFGAFSNCFALQTLTIPDSVTAIGSHAFPSCISLTAVHIPDTVSIARG